MTNTSGLWFKDKRLYIPAANDIRQQIISEVHDPPYRGHMGLAKTLHGISQRFYWPSINLDIKRCIETCGFCQQHKFTHQHKLGLLQSLDIPSYCWDSVAMEFITGLSKTRVGRDAILMIIGLARWCILLRQQLE